MRRAGRVVWPEPQPVVRQVVLVVQQASLPAPEVLRAAPVRSQVRLGVRVSFLQAEAEGACRGSRGTCADQSLRGLEAGAWSPDPMRTHG